MARRPGRVKPACWASLLVAAWASGVAAQPSARLALTWDGPAGCPTAENVQSRVYALLGEGESGSSVADVTASGRIERTEGGFRLLLTMGAGPAPSARVIEARTCDELAGAAAIAIALLARSSVASETAPLASAGASEPESSPPPAPPSIPPEEEGRAKASPPSAAPARLRLVLDVPVGAVGWGSLPATGFGLGAAVGARWKALRAAVGGELWLPQTARTSGFETRFTLQSGRAEACVMHDLQGVELGPCLGASVQRLTSEGIASSVFSARSRTVLWISGLGGLFASVETPGFAHLRFFGAARVLVSPSRPRFVIDQLGPVHEPSLAAPHLDLGCEWIF